MHSKHPWRGSRNHPKTTEEEEERYLNPNAPSLPQNLGSPSSFRKALCSAFYKTPIRERKAMDSTRVLVGISFFFFMSWLLLASGEVGTD
jgi:hypothetical protein